jgi:hypothetical protein
MTVTAKTGIVWVCLLICFALLSCEAPRNNPLDPLNPDSDLATLSGTILTLGLPSQPVTGARVTWRPLGRVATSGPDGGFAFGPFERSDGWLVVKKQGYLPDSIYVDWENNRHEERTVFLNAKPVCDSLSVYSRVLNRYPDRQTFSVHIYAVVTDSDNDIDSVIVRNTEIQFQSHLYRNENRYERPFSLADLKLKSIEQCVGYDFELLVRDRSGHIIPIHQDRIERVIYDWVEFKAPSGYQVVPPQPTLTWEPFDPGFSLSYTVEVYTDEIAPQRVVQNSGIDMQNTSWTVETSLPPGDYFWVIWCVDRFNNRARSRPASFTVQGL